MLAWCWQKISEFLKCPFEISLTLATDESHCRLHSFELSFFAQVHTRAIVREAVSVGIGFRSSARNKLQTLEGLKVDTLNELAHVSQLVGDSPPAHFTFDAC